MRVDEHDYDMLRALEEGPGDFPAWKPSGK
jgi:hypothetical protein